MEQRVDKLEQQVEHLSEAERKLDFITRDSSVKIGIAEGLAETMYREFTQFKIDMIQVRSEVRELRLSVDQNAEETHEKLSRQSTMLHELLTIARKQK